LSTKKYTNPFYILLLLAGIAFGVSSCAYGVMTVTMLDREEGYKVRESKEGLIYWMDQYGFQLLMTELVILGVATFSAIGTDDYWRKRANVDEQPNAESPNAESPNAESPNAESPNAESPNTEAPNTESPNTETPAD
jgi:hypothetical protein